MRDAGWGEVKRVLLTADTVGGVWSYALELAGEFDRRGIEVCLATMGPFPGPDQRAQVNALSNVELFEGGYKLEWMDDPWREVEEAGEWLLELEGLTSPDIVHLNGFVHGSLPFRAPVLVAGHSCVYSWYESVKGSLPPEPWEIYRGKVAYGLRCADFVAAPTLAMLRALRKHYGIQVSNGVINNGRSSEIFKPLQKEKIVFSAGRVWDEGKNISTVIRGASDFLWPSVIAGDNAGKEGSFTGVKFLGRIQAPEVAEWLGRASVFLHPALYEPFGLSVLEAALCGCALVLGNIDSLREVWGEAALYVSPLDREDVVKTVNMLAEDPEMLRYYSQAAGKRALNFTSSKMAESCLEVYRMMLRKRWLVT